MTLPVTMRSPVQETILVPPQIRDQFIAAVRTWEEVSVITDAFQYVVVPFNNEDGDYHGYYQLTYLHTDEQGNVSPANRVDSSARSVWNRLVETQRWLLRVRLLRDDQWRRDHPRCRNLYDFSEKEPLVYTHNWQLVCRNYTGWAVTPPALGRTRVADAEIMRLEASMWNVVPPGPSNYTSEVDLHTGLERVLCGMNPGSSVIVSAVSAPHRPPVAYNFAMPPESACSTMYLGELGRMTVIEFNPEQWHAERLSEDTVRMHNLRIPNQFSRVDIEEEF